MIDGRMVRVGVWVQGESTQTLGNKPTYTKDRDSYISISDNVTGRFNSQIDITRNVNTVTEKVYALSYDYDIKVRDKIVVESTGVEFQVESSNRSGRYQMLILKKVY